MTKDEIEKVIRESIARCRERDVYVRSNYWGVELAYNKWTVEPKRSVDGLQHVCPLGAVLICGPEELRERAGGSHLPRSAAALALGVSVEWVTDFTRVVDGLNPEFMGTGDAVEIATKISNLVHSGGSE